MTNKKTRNRVFLLGLVTLSFVIRSHRINQAFQFSSETGHELLLVKNTIETSKLPLSGIATSHPWLYFGPLYFWLMVPILALFSFDPLSTKLLGLFAGNFVIILNYFVVRKMFNDRIAVLSSILIAFSPLWIEFSRNARYFFFTSLVFYPFFYFLVQVWKNEKKYLFWLGFFYSISFNFHYSFISFLPLLAFLVIKKRKIFDKNDYLKIFLGLFIPWIPLLLFDSQRGFDMFSKLILWVPYRILGFMGLFPKNTVSKLTLAHTMETFTKFIGKYLFAPTSYWNISAVGFLLLFLWFVKFSITQRKQNVITRLLAILFLLGLLGLLIQGDARIHYYLSIFPIPILILSIFLNHFWSKNLVKILSCLFFLFILFVNRQYYLNYNEYFLKNYYKDTDKAVPYETQILISYYVVNDANSENFQLARIGEGDEFEGNFAQNYQYLMWKMGNEPVIVGDDITVDPARNPKYKYTIIEDVEKIPHENFDKVKWIEGIAILKDKLNNSKGSN